MFLSFLFKTIIISLSGVMAPGPITAMTVSKGTQNPHSGPMIAIGHGIVELPLILIIFFGFGNFLEISWVKVAIGFLGGLFLLKMGIGLIKNIFNSKAGQADDNYTPLQAGIVLSIANPYFLIWWATVGAVLITGAYKFGVWGLVAFILVHWSCDFVWYTILASLSFKGGNFFGERLQQILFAVCGVFLLFFSGKFIYDAIITIF